MIKTQELKSQIDELAKQNDMMMTQLEQMKQIISGGQQNQSNPSSGGDQSQGRQSSGSSAGQQDQGGNQAQQQNQGNRSLSGGGGNNHAAKLANDLLQIKDMVARLEEKTSQYVSNQTQGSLTEKDVVNLVLMLINGMIDWASDFVSSRVSSSGQKQ